MKNRVVVRAMAGLILAVLLAGGLAACGAFTGDKELIIGISTDYPPFSYVNAEGELAGFDYEYGKLLCENLKAKCEWQTDPFENIFDRTAQGDFDLAVSSHTQTEEREQLVHFSDPYYYSYGQFVRRAGSGAELDGSGVIAVQTNGIYERYMNSGAFANYQILFLENQVMAFEAVAEGRADLTIADDVLTDLAVNQSTYLAGGALGAFERVGEPIIPAPGTPEFDSLGTGAIGIVVSKDNADLLPDINRAIKEINQGQEIAAVSEGYFGRNIVSQGQ